MRRERRIKTLRFVSVFADEQCPDRKQQQTKPADDSEPDADPQRRKHDRDASRRDYEYNTHNKRPDAFQKLDYFVHKASSHVAFTASYHDGRMTRQSGESVKYAGFEKTAQNARILQRTANYSAFSVWGQIHRNSPVNEIFSKGCTGMIFRYLRDRRFKIKNAPKKGR
jgi:hypothetical protein|nr:MAG TPA: hypothetical protein [Caudoviricetes sp.]